MKINLDIYRVSFHLVLPWSRGAVQQLYKRIKVQEATTAIQYENAMIYTNPFNGTDKSENIQEQQI